MKRLSLIATFCTWMLTATIALATPASLFVAAPFARATVGAAINTSQMAGNQSVIQQLILAPGGYSGWHTHRGGAVIFVQAGTLSLYDDSCAKTVTAENRGAVERAGNVHLARNETSGLLILTVVFFDVPVGAAVRSDAATPACAVGADANNLPETSTPSGTSFKVPGGIVQRATFAAPFTITTAAERDVLAQRVTIAPGGDSGWHGHPGTVLVYVESGTLTFYDQNCAKQSYTAGQGAIESANQRLLARNDSTSPVVLRAVLFNIPVSGAARIDGAAASCAAVAGPVAAPALPNTSVDPGVSTGLDPAIVAILMALASVIALAAIQRSRVRSRLG